MEQMPQSKLSGMEAAMYAKFAEKYPGMSEDDFIELREIAKKGSTGVKTFFSKNGIIMEERPDSDEISEMSIENNQ